MKKMKQSTLIPEQLISFVAVRNQSVRNILDKSIMARSTSGDSPPARRRRIAEEEEDETLIPSLGGTENDDSVCYHCFSAPCVVSPTVLPDFVRGSAAPDPSNVARRYRLYRKFWSHLRRLGLWDYPPYKARKRRMGHENSPRDIIPWCVKTMVRERFPNPPGLPYKDHQWSADI